MTPLHLLDRMYGRGAHRDFKRRVRTVIPGPVHVRMIYGSIPSIIVEWANGAEMKLRPDLTTIHIQSLVNGCNGERPEGLYRSLMASSGLPQLFRSWGIDTITIEPRDAEARERLGHSYSDLWEVWTEPGYYPIWVWWLKPRTLSRAQEAVEFAHSIQEGRRRGEV